ncbi:hypothetical protein JOD96_000624 [Flavobacterium sp. 1355]|jgi:hypothetical protein|nr:hypothetical protein [Flavobacterium sp. 1355]
MSPRWGSCEKTNRISINMSSRWDLLYNNLKKELKIKKSAPDSYQGLREKRINA